MGKRGLSLGCLVNGIIDGAVPACRPPAVAGTFAFAATCFDPVGQVEDRPIPWCSCLGLVLTERR